jgi:hypothetical protein
MSPRKPPRVANWLLLFFGFYRKDSPLTGDLLEEFESGRSAAWFWRQTLALLLTGMSRNARTARKRLFGGLLGWAAEVSVTFLLWWSHFPSRLPHGRSVNVSVGISSLLVMVIVTFGLGVAFHKGRGGLKGRFADPAGLWMSAYEAFGRGLMVYCLMAMMGLQGQAQWALSIFKRYSSLLGLSAW